MSTVGKKTDATLLLDAYSIDSRRLSEQLGFILIIRGWAITIFIGILGSTVLIRNPAVATLEFLVLPLFYWIEATYDAYRFLLYRRVSILERDLASSGEFSSDYLAGLTDAEIASLPRTFSDALCRGRTYPIRVATYLLLTAATVAYLLIAR